MEQLSLLFLTSCTSLTALWLQVLYLLLSAYHPPFCPSLTCLLPAELQVIAQGPGPERPTWQPLTWSSHWLCGHPCPVHAALGSLACVAVTRLYSLWGQSLCPGPWQQVCAHPQVSEWPKGVEWLDPGFIYLLQLQLPALDRKCLPSLGFRPAWHYSKDIFRNSYFI